ncbi:MAG: TetR/AcrR family transcriptional regulator [Acidimicrobiales bacterium]|nr:TetR/AcrR family transcriptional regulator [Acidimicrobiales bacterium]
MSRQPTGRGVTPPAQRRSKETLERILVATERLLDGRAFAEISVLEICTEADVSASSFYARFASKEVLLEVLHQRHLDTRRGHVDLVAAELGQVPLPIEDLVRLAFSDYLDRHAGDAPLLQTLRQAEIDNPALADRRRALDRYTVELVADGIMPRILGADGGTRSRVVFATRACAATIQDAIHPPFAFAKDMVLDRDATLREIVRMWLRYVFSEDPVVPEMVPPSGSGPAA